MASGTVTEDFVGATIVVAGAGRSDVVPDASTGKDNPRPHDAVPMPSVGATLVVARAGLCARTFEWT